MTYIYLHRLQGQSCITIVYNENSSYSITIQCKNIKSSACQKSLEADFSGGKKYLRNFHRKVRDFYVLINQGKKENVLYLV